VMGSQVDRRCWKDDIVWMVELFKGSGPFRLIDAKTGDARRVASIVDTSDACREGSAGFKVTVDDGPEYVVTGTESYDPPLFSSYFRIKFAPEGNDGLIPEKIEVWDGGYVSYSCDMSVASPSESTLAFTLVNEAAAAINAPIRMRMAEAEEQKRAREEAEAQAASRAHFRDLEARQAQRWNEIKKLLVGKVVDAGPGPDRNGLATITLVYEDGRRVVVNQDGFPGVPLPNLRVSLVEE